MEYFLASRVELVQPSKSLGQPSLISLLASIPVPAPALSKYINTYVVGFVETL